MMKMVQSIAGTMRSSRTLVELTLGCTLGGPQGMRVLGLALPFAESLRKLSLAGSMLGDESFASLVEGLKVSNSLKELDISHCGLGDKSGAHLASIHRAHAAKRAMREWEVR